MISADTATATGHAIRSPKFSGTHGVKTGFFESSRVTYGLELLTCLVLTALEELYFTPTILPNCSPFSVLVYT